MAANLEKIGGRTEHSFCAGGRGVGEGAGREVGRLGCCAGGDGGRGWGGGAAAEPVEEKTEFDVIIKDAGAKKIDVIKVIRQLTSLGLGEAKTLAETAGGKVLTGVGKDAAAEGQEEAGRGRRTGRSQVDNFAIKKEDDS